MKSDEQQIAQNTMLGPKATSILFYSCYDFLKQAFWRILTGFRENFPFWALFLNRQTVLLLSAALSVRPSVTLVISALTVQDIVTHFALHDRAMIRVFCSQISWS